MGIQGVGAGGETEAPGVTQPRGPEEETEAQSTTQKGDQRADSREELRDTGHRPV